MAEDIVDLFPGAPRQMRFDLGDAPKRRSGGPVRDDVRRELSDVLAAAKAATDRCLWDRRTFQYRKTIFRRMPNRLPEDERDQLRFEFAEEVGRVEKLLAA